MNEIGRWTATASRVVVKDRWMTLRADGFLLPNGRTIDPYYVIEERDWVNVFARATDGRLLTVTQYRPAAELVCTELPGGVIDDGEEPLAAARRELLEETGFAAATWTRIGSVFANPARQTNRLHVWLAEDLGEGVAQSLDDTEEIVHQFETEDAVRSRIANGEFGQALHVAAFYMVLDHLRRRT